MVNRAWVKMKSRTRTTRDKNKYAKKAPKIPIWIRSKERRLKKGQRHLKGGGDETRPFRRKNCVGRRAGGEKKKAEGCRKFAGSVGSHTPRDEGRNRRKTRGERWNWKGLGGGAKGWAFGLKGSNFGVQNTPVAAPKKLLDPLHRGKKGTHGRNTLQYKKKKREKRNIQDPEKKRTSRKKKKKNLRNSANRQRSPAQV